MIALQCTNDTTGNGYDLMITKAGMRLAHTTPQNQAFILTAHKGDFKEYPLLGVGLTDIVNDNDFNEWKREITAQLETDGQRITQLELTAKGLHLEAQYK